MIKSFRDMQVWKDSMNLAVEIFELTDNFPKKEDYSITSQIRRSATSISANIAEAFGRFHAKDKINFYYFARGSVTETQSHLIYSSKVEYLSVEKSKDLIIKLDEIMFSLNKIIKTLRLK
ncbi:MAG: four helix bundle protein [Candidatus Cloacimonadota bacterium]|nr:four helix bundle protein [Candidatus Cloacimonadota bacterium]